MLKQAIAWLRNVAKALIYPRPLLGVLYLPRYVKHWLSYSRASKQKIHLLDMQPCLGDWSTYTPFDAHYFYQGAWLARRLAASNPDKHVDIGSSVLTMSVLSAQIDITFVDYRPIKANLPGLTSVAGDILNLAFQEGSLDSLSCLHVIEHIGLGRYGDPINPQGSLQAAAELQRVARTGGRLYLSLPVGRERVCFNAHRIHAPQTVLSMFPQMKLVEFSYVDDLGQFHQSASPAQAEGLDYGCGMFLFEKS